VKILDGRTRDGHYWVHVAPLSDAAFRVRVADTETGVSREDANAPGAPRAVIDRLSFQQRRAPGSRRQGEGEAPGTTSRSRWPAARGAGHPCLVPPFGTTATSP
jgi:hypothetical protein